MAAVRIPHHWKQIKKILAGIVCLFSKSCSTGDIESDGDGKVVHRQDASLVLVLVSIFECIFSNLA